MPEDNEDRSPLTVKPFETAAERHGLVERVEHAVEGFLHRGLSHTPGLQELPDSRVPGTDRNHVQGPQQAACDPVAAGLSTSYVPATRAENRVITRTGDAVSGTHAPGVDPAPSDHSEVVAPLDTVADSAPGPNAKPGELVQEKAEG